MPVSVVWSDEAGNPVPLKTASPAEKQQLLQDALDVIERKLGVSPQSTANVVALRAVHWRDHLHDSNVNAIVQLTERLAELTAIVTGKPNENGSRISGGGVILP